VRQYYAREAEEETVREFLQSVETDDTSIAETMKLAIADELTIRQREMISMYYLQGIPMPEIARELGVNVSTVSRTIKRGRRRLKRCIRYGSSALLKAALEE
jgi:RNA polymerase sigma factor (sigma-70 family)